MAEEKNLKKTTFFWAHIGVIVYHFITAVLLLLSQFFFGDTSGKITVVVLAVILLVVSLGSTYPIVKDYNKKIIIE